MAFRIYSETLPLREVARPEVAALLARYGLAIVLAVRPWELDALPAVVRALSDRGVSVSVWPMLADEEGRWASVYNAREFGALVARTIDTLEAARARPREVFFDMEPPFGEARALVHHAGIARRAAAALRRARDRAAFDDAEAVLAASVASLRDRGIATAAAAWPLVALDGARARSWQRALGTPVDALAVDRVSVMAYTSLFAGWSLGAVRRRDAAAILARTTALTRARWGVGAGISLGCVGTGAFEHEPVYASPRELAEDVATARAEGCADLTLFDLGGVLARGPAETWLDAFTAPDAAPAPRSTPRVSVGALAVRAATRALARAQGQRAVRYSTPSSERSA